MVRKSPENYTPQYDNEFKRKPTDDPMRLSNPWEDNAEVPAIVAGARKDMVKTPNMGTAAATTTSSASPSTMPLAVIPPKHKAGGAATKTKPPPPGVQTQGIKPPPPLRGGAEPAVSNRQREEGAKSPLSHRQKLKREIEVPELPQKAAPSRLSTQAGAVHMKMPPIYLTATTPKNPGDALQAATTRGDAVAV